MSTKVNSSFKPLHSDLSPVIVYVDLKSPYAFIAKDPTRALEAELGLTFDWRPLTLNIPSYLGSAKLDRKSGKVAESTRSKDQWGAVKYAYRDARRYAALQGYPLRGTEKIWDTSLVHRAFSWIKQQAPDCLPAFLDDAYPPFWQRALDVEDLAIVTQLLERCGAPTNGFEAWAAGPGLEQHEAEQQAIFAAGIYGVPTYVHDGDFWFGREHLPILRHRLTGDAGPEPGIAYGYLRGQAGRSPKEQAAFEPVTHVELQLDLREAQSYLGLDAALTLFAKLGRWPKVLPFQARPPTAPVTDPLPDDRPGQHRHHRDRYRLRSLEAQATAAGLTIARRFEQPEIPLTWHAWLWAEAQGEHEAFARWLRATFESFWERSEEPEDADAIAHRLDAAGYDGQTWRALLTTSGTLDAEQQTILEDALSAATSRAVFEGPRFILDDEPYSGRVHLPLLRERLRLPPVPTPPETQPPRADGDS